MSGLPPGRPRSQRARAATLAAAAELLRERGLVAMTMDEIARRADVSKSTVYRWWPSKELLALDALGSQLVGESEEGDARDLSLREDLRERVQVRIERFRERPWLASVLPALLAHARRDPEFAAELLERIVKPRRAAVGETLRRAIERGELPPDTDVELVVDMIFAPVWHRFLHGHPQLDERVGEQVVDVVLAGLGWKPSQRDAR